MMIFDRKSVTEPKFRSAQTLVSAFITVNLVVLPLFGAFSGAYAQSPLTDQPAQLKFLFKQGVPLPPSRPTGFEAGNPMEPPKSDIVAPPASDQASKSAPESVPAPESGTPKLPLQPLAVPDLGGSDVSAPLPKLPSASASPLFAKVPLPPKRPKELMTAAAPTEPPPAMPMMIEKPKVIHGNQQKLEPVQELPKEDVIKKASAVLSDMPQFQAEFTQIDGTGKKITGHLAVARPGRLRFDYDPPSNVIVIADGNNVGIIDRKLKTRDVYALFLTPLKFLLKEKIDLGSDISVLDVRSDKDNYIIVTEDKSTFAGTSKIALSFDKRSLKITQWTVTDPQGYDTTVILGPIDTSTEPDGDLFVIPEKVG